MVADYDPVILIHGAWQGSWVWDRLLPLLEAEGLTCAAVDLPGNGSQRSNAGDVSLESYVDHVGGILSSFGRPATAVGHSGGGMIASAVAEAFPDSVARIAYVAGMMLPSGVGFGDLVREMLPDHPDIVGVGAALLWSDDRTESSVPPEAGATYFLNDCDREEALGVAARLTPQKESGRAISVELTAHRFGSKPRLYVEATADKSVLVSAQRRMQELVPGAIVETISSGHAPHYSRSEDLAEILVPFLKGGRDEEARSLLKACRAG